MLFLMFRIGVDRYVLDVDQIEQVLPLMAAKEVPGAPDGVVGVISYHGDPVPLIDLSLLGTGRSVTPVMSSRIILVRYPAPDGETMRLALCAERVIETIQRDPTEFVSSGLEAGTPAYLGPVAADEAGLIQWVKAQALLSNEIREILFRHAGAPA